MIVDNNLIAYEYFKDQFTPKEIYKSGEREESKLNDKYKFKRLNAPIIALKDDIINKDGYGLKSGFYSVYPDKYLDFLYVYQQGKLKAKVPVIKLDFFETTKPKQERVKKMSYSKYLKEQEKEYRKYMNGISEEELDWQEADIFRSKDNDAWIIKYSSKNLDLYGVIKF